MVIKNRKGSFSLKKIISITILLLLFILVLPNSLNLYENVKLKVTNMGVAENSYLNSEKENVVTTKFQDDIESFAKNNNINKNKLFSFFDVETNNKFFESDGHPSVRFECLKFNNVYSNSNQVPCKVTLNKKYGVDEDTNYDAFKRAKLIDNEAALMSSSFGIGQIMGFNYKLAGYNSVEEFYKDQFDKKKQISSFLVFISKSKGGKILKELQKSQTDWQEVAELYNGKNFKDNNYDTKLVDAFNKYNSLDDEVIS